MSSKLTRNDWLKHGLMVLETTGHEALKADLLVKGLKVSRGSFYWHFKDLSDFHRALVAEWKEQNTEIVIAGLKQIPAGNAQIEAVLTHCLETELPREAAMRRWSRINTSVAKAVQDVDQVRFTFLFDILKEQGLSASDARARATLLVWAYIGRSFAGSFAEGLTPDASPSLRAMLLAGAEIESQ